jgi:hypothetical protein
MNNLFGKPFQVSESGVTGAYAVATAIAGGTYYITDISVASDIATGGQFYVYGGTGVIWSGMCNAGATVEHSFVTPIQANEGLSVTTQVNATTYAHASMAGYLTTK